MTSRFNKAGYYINSFNVNAMNESLQQCIDSRLSICNEGKSVNQNRYYVKKNLQTGILAVTVNVTLTQ